MINIHYNSEEVSIDGFSRRLFARGRLRRFSYARAGVRVIYSSRGYVRQGTGRKNKKFRQIAGFAEPQAEQSGDLEVLVIYRKVAAQGRLQRQDYRRQRTIGVWGKRTRRTREDAMREGPRNPFRQGFGGCLRSRCNARIVLCARYEHRGGGLSVGQRTI